jgi:hypothetical protein
VRRVIIRGLVHGETAKHGERQSRGLVHGGTAFGRRAECPTTSGVGAGFRSTRLVKHTRESIQLHRCIGLAAAGSRRRGGGRCSADSGTVQVVMMAGFSGKVQGSSNSPRRRGTRVPVKGLGVNSGPWACGGSERALDANLVKVQQEVQHSLRLREVPAGHWRPESSKSSRFTWPRSLPRDNT